MDTQNTSELTTPLLEWQAPLSLDHERSLRWYIVAGTIAVLAVAYGIFSGAWTLSVTVATLTALYFLVRNQKHPLHTIRILPLGIELDGVLRPWTEFSQFWMLAGNNHAELHVASKNSLHRDIVILTGNVDPLTIGSVISEYLENHPNPREKLLDAIIRFCKL